MKKTILFPLLILGVATASLFFSSCAPEDSTDVNQDRIYTVYELFYNSNTDKTQVTARFRFGNATGTILELKGSSGESVTFEGDPLPYNALASGHYKEVAGRLASGEFVYTDSDGKTYTNTVPAGDTVAFPSDFDTVFRSKAQTLKWEGSVLGSNEYVGVFIGTAWTWGQDALFAQVLKGTDEIVMGVKNKANLNPGPATAFMDRVGEQSASQTSSAGGVVRYRYRAKNKTVLVVD